MGTAPVPRAFLQDGLADHDVFPPPRGDLVFGRQCWLLAFGFDCMRVFGVHDGVPKPFQVFGEGDPVCGRV